MLIFTAVGLQIRPSGVNRLISEAGTNKVVVVLIVVVPVAVVGVEVPRVVGISLRTRPVVVRLQATAACVYLY